MLAGQEAHKNAGTILEAVQSRDNEAFSHKYLVLGVLDLLDPLSRLLEEIELAVEPGSVVAAERHSRVPGIDRVHIVHHAHLDGESRGLEGFQGPLLVELEEEIEIQEVGVLFDFERLLERWLHFDEVEALEFYFLALEKSGNLRKKELGCLLEKHVGVTLPSRVDVEISHKPRNLSVGEIPEPAQTESHAIKVRVVLDSDNRFEDRQNRLHFLDREVPGVEEMRLVSVPHSVSLHTAELVYKAVAEAWDHPVLPGRVVKKRSLGAGGLAELASDDAESASNDSPGHSRGVEGGAEPCPSSG